MSKRTFGNFGKKEATHMSPEEQGIIEQADPVEPPLATEPPVTDWPPQVGSPSQAPPQPAVVTQSAEVAPAEGAPTTPLPTGLPPQEPAETELPVVPGAGWPCASPSGAPAQPAFIPTHIQGL